VRLRSVQINIVVNNLGSLLFRAPARAAVRRLAPLLLNRNLNLVVELGLGPRRRGPVPQIIDCITLIYCCHKLFGGQVLCVDLARPFEPVDRRELVVFFGTGRLVGVVYQEGRLVYEVFGDFVVAVYDFQSFL